MADFLRCWKERALQRDLDTLGGWAVTNYLKFNKSKGQILHLGRGYHEYMYKLGDEMPVSSPSERDLGMWSMTS